MVSIYDTVAAITVVAVIKLSQVKVVRGLTDKDVEKVQKNSWKPKA